MGGVIVKGDQIVEKGIGAAVEEAVHVVLCTEISSKT
jgi:hypothetical protein